ncbi:MAG TPA: 2OG-Fe(II) oxygenase [Aeromonadales bacterium]|nr:2OG-Fe(II) oxygenase [Aeromonadales bacterium]
MNDKNSPHKNEEENSADYRGFIGIYPDALPGDLCDEIIHKFNHSPHKNPGLTGNGIDRQKKLSEDITISSLPEWQTIQQKILNHTFDKLLDYFHRHHFLIIGSLSPNVIHPKTKKPVTLNHKNYAEFGEQYLKELIPYMYRTGTINVQKYQQSKGGYPHWHSEIYPQNESCETLHRVLLFMFYLNDVEEGGETEFYYQKEKVAPKKGTMVIAPADFTHTHRGNKPLSGDKYILTSWIMYQRAEKLFSNQGS